MTVLTDHLRDRYAEVSGHLAYLLLVDEARAGGRAASVLPSVDQNNVLKAFVYVLIYNLVESTIVRCLEAVTRSAVCSTDYGPGDLTEELQREWVRHMARTHVEMGADKRLTDALALFNYLIAQSPVGAFNMEKGGGGNWDDVAIERIVARMGFPLDMPPADYSGVKRAVKNNKGAMSLMVEMRNDLAHGSLSFADCGRDESVSELSAVAESVLAYLKGVVAAFDKYIAEHRFLRPEKRPNG